MIAIFLTIAALVLGLAHYIIYKSIVVIFGIYSWKIITTLRIVFFLLAVSFISASAMTNRYNNWFTRGLYKVSAIWLGFATYFFFASGLYGLVVLFSPFTASDLSKFGLTFYIIAFIASVYGLFNARRLRTTRYEVALPNLPESWKGKHVVMVSDIHLGQVNAVKFAAKIVARIQELKPEVVFICGDLYDGVKVNEQAIISPLASLKAPQGVYFITGNHEEFEDSTHFLNAIRATGIRVLTNEKIDLAGIQLIGVTDHDSTDRVKYPDILKNISVDPHKASILLKHQPNFLNVAEPLGVGLQLSGHTHRAQMWPFCYIAQWVFHGYDYGLKKFGGMQVITSSGAGTWGPPFRVGSKSEVVEITLK